MWHKRSGRRTRSNCRVGTQAEVGKPIKKQDALRGLALTIVALLPYLHVQSRFFCKSPIRSLNMSLSCLLETFALLFTIHVSLMYLENDQFVLQNFVL